MNLIGKVFLLWLGMIGLNYPLLAQSFLGFWHLDSTQTQGKSTLAEGYFWFSDSTYEALEIKEASRTGFLNGTWHFSPTDSIIHYQGKTAQDTFSIVLVQLSKQTLVFKNRNLQPTFYYLTKQKNPTKTPHLIGKWIFTKILSLPSNIENTDFKKEFEQKIKNQSYLDFKEDKTGISYYAEKSKPLTWEIGINRKFLVCWINKKKVPFVYRIKIKNKNTLHIELFDDYWFELTKQK